MRIEINIPEHQYNNIMAFDFVNLGRVPYKGIIMYTINAIKHGRVLDQEPTTKNDLGVKNLCELCGNAINCPMQAGVIREECGLYKPTTKNNLGVEEVTALAEWTEKLTKASEDAYNKGYEAGRKELEPITSKDKFIYALTACGCLLKDGKTWYEHNELIKCFEDLGLFEQEPILDKIRAELTEKRDILAEEAKANTINPLSCYGLDYALLIIDKYKAESEKA